MYYFVKYYSATNTRGSRLGVFTAQGERVGFAEFDYSTSPFENALASLVPASSIEYCFTAKTGEMYYRVSQRARQAVSA